MRKGNVKVMRNGLGLGVRLTENEFPLFMNQTIFIKNGSMFTENVILT